MTKYSRVKGDFRSRVGVCLRAALAAALMAVALPALGAPHPIHYAQAREVVVHHGRAHHVFAQTAPDSGSAKSSKPDAKAKAGTAHGAKPPAKSSTKRRHRKPRSEEADNDPPVLHRAALHDRRPRHEDAPRGVVRTNARVVAEEKPVQKMTVTSEDFVRAAGGDPMHGTSHPEDDERLPSPVVAQASAAPEPVTPVGKTTLPEKLHAAAANAETAMKSDAASAKSALSGRGHARASVLPEDHAARAAVAEQAMQPMILPTLYTRRGRLIVPPPMKGSWDILVHQNEMADSEGLDRIQDDDDLDRLRTLHLLVPLPQSVSLSVNEELPENRRYARPWASRFAADTARAFYARFHQPLHLNSAVRTVEYQIRLQRVNGNAAAVDGDGASPHLTGQALDFGKRGMSIAQIAWMRAYLAPLMRAGKVDVEEEFQQACFHISVYRSYGPVMKPRAKGAAKVEVAKAEFPRGAVRGETVR